MATQADIHGQIDLFKAWVSEQFQNGSNERTIDDLFDEWRIENPTNAELTQSVDGLKRALDQADRGEGRSVDEFARDFRDRHNLPPMD